MSSLIQLRSSSDEIRTLIKRKQDAIATTAVAFHHSVLHTQVSLPETQTFPSSVKFIAIDLAILRSRSLL